MQIQQFPKLSYRPTVFIAMFLILFLFCGVAAWGSLARISGAVLATGTVVVKGKPKSIQHLDGGVVKAIHIDAGDVVRKGQALIELDDTNIAANLEIYKSRLRDSLLRKRRLLAELNGEDAFEIPMEDIRKYELTSVREAFEQQAALMKARQLTRQAQSAQFVEKIKQLENQIDGVSSLIKEKKLQIDTFEDEAKAVSVLVKRKLAAKSRLMSLERARADMRGQIAEHGSEIARHRNAISETRIAKLQTEREFREKVVAELETTDAGAAELKQQISATVQQLGRVVIRSPVAGVVHELNQYTIGGVVQPGQVLMQIISDHGQHEFELNVDAVSVDQVQVGQRAIIRFPAFNQRTTPELNGKIESLSPSSVVDEQSGLTFYRIIVSINEAEMGRLGSNRLVSGMPVEGFVPTSERTVLSYLIKPLMDQLAYALREE